MHAFLARRGIQLPENFGLWAPLLDSSHDATAERKINDIFTENIPSGKKKRSKVLSRMFPIEVTSFLSQFKMESRSFCFALFDKQEVL